MLLVEDEAFISLLIQEAVTNLGCDIIGPATTIAASIALLDVEQIDVALVDLALNGKLCLPVADVLADVDELALLLTELVDLASDLAAAEPEESCSLGDQHG